MEVTAYEDDFAGFGEDILGDKKVEQENEEEDWSSWGERRKKKQKDSPTLNVSFDFRRGKNHWPEGAELVDDEMAEELLRKAEEEANKANEMLKEKGKMDGFDDVAFTSGGYGTGGGLTGFGNSAYGPMMPGGDYSRWGKGKGNESDDDDGFVMLGPALSPAPEDAKFETLADRSTALYIQTGQRIKLDMRYLTEIGKAAVDRERKTKEKEQRKQAKAELAAKEAKAAAKDSSDITVDIKDADDLLTKGTQRGEQRGAHAKDTGTKSSYGGGSGFADMYDFDDDFAGAYGGMLKQMVNEYTITMDVRLKNDVPREGLSLFQTSLIHMEENSRTGKKKLKQSTGECLINSEGGVGILGKYGETLEARIEKNRWHRIVIAVKCGKENNKGQIRTWIDAQECAKISSTEVTKDGRFAIDPDALFLFSSSKGGMMPGGILLRHIKVEGKFAQDTDVASGRAEDKFLSMFMEDRKAETDELRRGLSLAALFPKPRPIWTAPALTGTVGDAYLEGTNLTNTSMMEDKALDPNSLIGWSFVVLNHTIKLAVKEQAKFMGTFSQEARSTVSDVCYIVSRSSTMMKHFLRLLRHKKHAQLISFLKKLRKEVEGLGVGESMILPALVEDSEMIIIIIRTNDQRYRFVVVQTDPQLGLRHHPVSPVDGPPKLKYRTCMVLSNVSKKNAQDNVFWLGVYNLAISCNEGDMDKFYDVLLPFLTGKPLETSLVEAEVAASKSDDLGATGEWRSPQRSETGHVRCLLEAFNYLLRSRGLSSLEAKQVSLALRAQFVQMITNDMDYITPNENGQRVCRLACAQLGYAAVKLVTKKAQSLKQENASEGKQPDRDETGKKSVSFAGEEEKVVEALDEALLASGAKSKQGEEEKEGNEVIKSKEPQSFTEYVHEMLSLTKEMVDKVHKKLDACKNNDIELPSMLSLKANKPIVPPVGETANSDAKEVAAVVKTQEPSTTKVDHEEESAAQSEDAVMITVKIKHSLPRGDQRPIEVKVNSKGNAQQLFTKIQQLTGVPPELQRLVFMGKLLNPDKKLSAYKITRDKLTIHLATKNIPDDKIREAMSENKANVPHAQQGDSKQGEGANDDLLPNGLDPAFTQFQDMLAWDLERSVPDPGNVVSLNSYVPIDFLQVPTTITTRYQGIMAIRQCDRLCTLLDNQAHCVKNRKLLVFALVQYVFTEVLPVPKPRPVRISGEEEYRAGRRDRRRVRKYEAWKDIKRNENVKRRKTPGYMKKGKIVEVQYEGENLWYKAEIVKVDLDAAIASIVYEDGEEVDNVPFANIRGILGANKRSKPATTAPKNAEGGEKNGEGNQDEDDDDDGDDLFDAIDALGEEQGVDMSETPEMVEQPGANDNNNNKKSNDLDGDEEEFKTGENNLKTLLEEECVWDAPITYELQLEVIMSLQRVLEHFVAAMCSIQQDRAIDGVGIVVAGAITAIADAVMRRRATDVPSHVCSHLMGVSRDGKRLGVFGYGIGVSWFSKQTENIEIHNAEVSMTRTAVLDYFQSPEQKKLHKIFTWEQSYQLKLNKHTIEFIRNISRDFASSEATTASLSDRSPELSKLFKNYPELRSYRDIVFWWKYLLNPDVTEFPSYVNPKKESFHVSSFDRMDAILCWRWDAEDYRFIVTGLNRELHCRPNPEKDGTGQVWKADRQPSQHRYPSTAKPSFYVPKPEIRTEDDVVYRPSLPGFEYPNPRRPNAAKIHVLGQHDSELLISYLTVPYLRLPLVLTFFASDDRLHKLQSPKLRGILDAVLFEPGKYLRMDHEGVCPVTVPTTHPDLLATSHGMLLNELQHSPEVVLRGIISILRGALALDTGSVCDGRDKEFNSGVEIILYVTRIGARVANYISFLIQVETGTHECVHRKLRGVYLTKDCLLKLQEGLHEIEQLLHVDFEALFEHYLKRLGDEVEKNPNDEELIGRNSRLSCDLHAHKLLMYRNLTKEQLTTDNARVLISSFVYLTTRHSWNRYRREKGRLTLPETELYELLQHRKRSLVEWCRELTQGDLDGVMQSALQISTSATGSVKTSTEMLDASNRWSRIKGNRSVGRYAVASTRSKKLGSKTGPNSSKALEKKSELPKLVRQTSETTPVDEVPDDGRLGVEMDLQIGQMTLRSRHLSALDDDIANDEDVRLLFGTTDIQASLLDSAEYRTRYRLVGLQHDLSFWGVSHRECPAISDEWERDYDPSEMFESELWILPIFEPVRNAFFRGPVPTEMQFLMPALALPEDAEVAVLLGLSQVMGGPYKLVYVFRRLKCVHVYQCVSHGRQWHWTLHMTTDTRYCLRELQPYSFNRNYPFPAWLKNGSGQPYPPAGSSPEFLYSNIDTATANFKSVVIEREPGHPKNLSGGTETFLPIRFLYGLIPQCLLDEYHFWQDEGWSEIPKSRFGRHMHPTQVIRGYPRKKDNEYMLIIEIQRVGTWLDVQRRKPGAKNSFNDNGVEILGGLPGRTIRVRRTRLETVEDEFHRRAQIALVLETSQLLRDKEEEDAIKAKVAAEEEAKRMSAEEAAEVAAAGRIARKEKKKYGSTKYVESKDFVAVGQQVKYFVKKVQAVMGIVIGKNEDGTFDVKLTSGGSKGVILRDVAESDLEPKVKVYSNNETPVKWQGMDDSEDAIWDTSSEEELSGERAKNNNFGSDDEKEELRHLRKKLNFSQFNSLNQLLKVTEHDVERCTDILYHLAAIPGTRFTDIKQLAKAVELHHQSLPVRDHKQDDNGESTEKQEEKVLVEEEDMILLNLLYAPRRSRLHSLMKTLSRIENMSNVCAWTKVSSMERMLNEISESYPSLVPNGQRVVRGCPDIDLVELPRLKLSFTTRKDHEGQLRLYSMDHADLFVTNDRNPLTAEMLKGIPHSLLMSNSEGETQVLVPVIPPIRPKIVTEPFTTQLVLVREDEEWFKHLTQRYFLYPVHVSMSFLLTRGVESALYLMLLRFLQRSYAEVFRLADSIATDSKYSATGKVIFDEFKRANQDAHPDAHACRLKMSLVTLDGDMELPWDLTTQCAGYVTKLPHVSAACRMSKEEELQILETEDAIVFDEKDVFYDKSIHNPFMCAIVQNRLFALRAIVSAGGVGQVDALQLLKDDTADLDVADSNSKSSTSSLQPRSSELVSLNGTRQVNVSDGTLVKVPCVAPSRTPSSGWPYYTDNTVFGEKYAGVVQVQTIEEWERQLRCRGVEDLGERCRPARGWLVVACFHTLWFERAVQVLSSLQELAPAFPACTFVSVRADAIGLSALSHEHNVVAFPTFVMFRNGEELEDDRIIGSNRATESLVRFLQENIDDDDRQAYQNFIEGDRKDSAEGGANESGENAEADHDDGEEIQWTWDVEQCGLNMRIEGLGMAAVLQGDDDDGPQAVWEFTTQDRYSSTPSKEGWEPFPIETSKELEKQYAKGLLYDDCLETNIGRPVYVWENRVKISNNMITGMNGEFQTPPWEDIQVRRRGMRLVVPGEPEVDAEQKLVDQQVARMREIMEDRKQQMRAARKGKDVEAIRGTVGFVPNSGTHKWTVRWNHEPTRSGKADGVGFTSEASESYGPSAAPLLGGDDESSSVALYANGELYHGSKKIGEAPSRVRKTVEQRVADMKEREDHFKAEMKKRKEILKAAMEAKKGKKKRKKAKQGAESKVAEDDEKKEETATATTDGESKDSEAKGEKTEEDPAATKTDGEKSTTDEKADGEKSTNDEKADGEKSTTDEKAEGEKSTDEKADGEKSTTDKKADGETKSDSDGKTDGEKSTDKKEEESEETKKRKELLQFLVDQCPDAPLGSLAKVEQKVAHNLWGQSSEVTVILNTEIEDGLVTFQVDGVDIPELKISGLFTLLGGGAVYPSVCMAPFENEPAAEERRRKFEEQNKKLRAGALASAATKSRKLRGKEMRESKMAEPVDEEPPTASEKKTDAEKAEAEKKKKEEEAEKKEKEQKYNEVLEKAWKATFGVDKDELRKFDQEKLEQLTKLAEELIVGQPTNPTVYVLGQNDDGLAISMMEELQNDAKARAAENGEEVEEEEEDEDENSDSDADAEDADKDQEDNDEDAIPLEQCMWMHETDRGWDPYSVENCKQLELARRSGAKECELYVDNSHVVVNFGKDAKVDSEQVSGTGESTRVRRHVVSDGLMAQAEMLSLHFNPPSTMIGRSCVKVLQNIWNGKEDMLGRKCGYGFLLLYHLLQGQMHCKVVGSGWWDRYNMGYGSGASKSDSHRFGVLLSQLYVDRRKKSLPTSIINVLSQNRQICPRMRKFRDNRKSKRSRIFNGWVDDVEPHSPLANLLSSVVPALQDLRRRRGAMQFPPRPPHPELPAPPKEYFLKLDDDTDTSKNSNGETTTASPENRMEMKPELSDTSCSVRNLEPVSVEEVAELAHLVGHPIGKEERWFSEPPLLIDSVRGLKELLETCIHEIIVIKFFATWCRPCESLDPVYRVLANTTPIARFLKIDIDDCDEIAKVLQISSVPTVCMFRIPSVEARAGMDGKKAKKVKLNFGLGERLTTIRGAGSDGGLEFRELFVEQLGSIATVIENQVAKKAGVFDIPTFVRADDERRGRIDVEAADQSVIQAASESTTGSSSTASSKLEFGKKQSKTDLAAAAKRLHMETSLKDVECMSTMPLREFSKYVCYREDNATTSQDDEQTMVRKLPFNLHNHDAASNAVAKSMLNRMEADMEAWSKAASMQHVAEMKCFPKSVVVEYFAEASKSSLEEPRSKLRDILAEMRAARDRDSVMVQESIPLLKSVANWIHLPTVSEGHTDEDRHERLKHLLRRDAGQEPEVWIEFLFGALLSSRASEDIKRLNPFLEDPVIDNLLKFVNVVVLRANRVGHINRCIGSGLKLLRLVERANSLKTTEERAAHAATLIPNLCQASEAMARNLVSVRHYVSHADKASSGVSQFDPRFLIFEFTWNIMLRRKQVEIVNMFMENLTKGNSKVKQMIMGAGKTTVVAPLLALMLADGDSLVLSVVPKALLEMSRKRMRETFATIMQKRVYTLKFDRGTEVKPSMSRGLENAARNRGIVVATPTAVKSIMLAYVEGLSNLKVLKEQVASDKATAEEMEDAEQKVTELGRVLRLFKSGAMLLDEVDLILHPLKSELNFPIGEKYDLDVTEHGERWSLPMHLLDAMYFPETGKVCTFEQRGSALDILKRLNAKVDAGYVVRALQKLPHITLLNTKFYHRELKPVLAEWAYLWLQNQHLHGVDHAEAIQYILQGAASRSETTTKVTNLEKEMRRLANGNESEHQLKVEHHQLITNKDVDSNLLGKRLQEALDSAKEHSELTHEVYELQGEYEQFLEQSSTRMAMLQEKIADTTAKLEEAQYPRDDSLDNATVVWLASKIESNTSLDSSAQGENANSSGNPTTSVLAQCGRLEDQGYTVKLCDDRDEALKRARELFSKGQLRCFIIGGGEQMERGCGKDCKEDHDGLDCLRCEEEWDDHDNHMCENGNGVRGSFPITGKSDDDVDVSSVAWSATGRGNLQIPENRVFVFCGHCMLDTWVRLDLWRREINTADRPEDLLQLVEMVEEYPEEDEEQKVPSVENVEKDLDFLGSDNEDDNKVDDVTTDQQPTKHEIPVPRTPPGGRPKLTRQASAGTVRLEQLKLLLDKLEKKKAKFSEKEEQERKKLRSFVSSAYDKLRHSIDSRVSLLRSVCKKQVALSNGKVKLGDKSGISISYGHEAALALSWIDEYGNIDEATADADPDRLAKLQQMVATLENECNYLDHIALAAKVMAHVSLFHKKLLNLTYDWLKTFMPHCLAKVNRVSFGLLNEDDCAEALLLDPMMPRSRLKLAVPFVGKDVPSASSEFAHPDVIIGLTILAYRYSGMRSSDFDDIVDGLTSDFYHEIGPASERPSTKRHELWVRESGGRIRGITVAGVKKIEDATNERKDDGEEEDDDGEVVQLKYLQKSNYEQTTKLFKLWKTQPHVIHYYLNHFIFPAHMRSQRVKISSSGQAVGGDMLFGHRIGFSGTPSDLLPKELGKCDYETGDDGKMLSTVLDPNITSFEHMDNDWTVEDLLKRIATANPRVNALIDTGALITGYSNQEVAAKMLEMGLAWCDGVVFLDSQDRQQVLVRATNRVVNADQCGIPLEKRFAFYDQIHTTGMDIQHVVNARAVVTLGKDMVFRDYVQGVYRMRGIGQGQCVTVFIIPEVKTLMKREMSRGVEFIKLADGSDLPEKSKVLVDIVAWLIINSMRSEQVQWSMLCQQSVANVYRKNAFQRLMLESNQATTSLDDNKPIKDGIVSAKAGAKSDKPSRGTQQSDAQPQSSACEVPARPYLTPELVERLYELNVEDCSDVFDEAVDFSLEATVPDPIPFAEKLRTMLDTHQNLLMNESQRAVGDEILAEVEYYSEMDGEDMSQRLESEQEREQEQEQEKEVKAKRDQQIEVEKFVDREYSRANESPVAWAFSTLSRPPTGGKGNFDRPFHQLSTLTLRHQDPLKFPQYLYFSRNYFNPEWNSLRRVKNVIMVLEWAPSMSQTNVVPPEDCRAQNKLSKSAEAALEKAYKLLAARTGELTPEDVYNTIRAATDVKVTQTQLTDIMAQFGNERDAIDQAGLRDLLTSGILRQEERGRYFVAVSLAEAETIKRILHVKRSNAPRVGTNSIIRGSDAEIALRYTPLTSFGTSNAFLEQGMIFESSPGWTVQGSVAPDTKVPRYQASVAHNCMRFLDCNMHYNEPSLNVLIRALQNNPVHERERFFFSTIGFKRRMERKWQETPLAKVFTVDDEWVSLKQRAQAVFMREAIEAKKLTLWEAFTAFDADDNGVLSPAEFYGAVRWLGMKDLSPEDVVDMIEAADRNSDGLIDYKEYLEMLKDPDSDGEGEVDEEQHVDAEGTDGSIKRAKPLVEPYGADTLREVMVERKREELRRQRDDRLKRQSYQKTLDIKVFEEELEASKNRVGGPNPRIFQRDSDEQTLNRLRVLEDYESSSSSDDDESTFDGGSDSDEDKSEPERNRKQVCEYLFNGCDKPLRMVKHGQVKFAATFGRSQIVTQGAIRSRTTSKCYRGHPLMRYNSYWDSCSSCGQRRTEWECYRCYDSFYLCRKCHKRIEDSTKLVSEKISESDTFIECSMSSFITVQIPTALADRQINLDSITKPAATEDGTSEPVELDVSCTKFTISLEVRVTKLPSRGQLAALLRFSPPQMGRSRRRNQASVYIDEHGLLTDGSTLNRAKILEAQLAAKKLEDEAKAQDQLKKDVETKAEKKETNEEEVKGESKDVVATSEESSEKSQTDDAAINKTGDDAAINKTGDDAKETQEDDAKKKAEEAKKKKEEEEKKKKENDTLPVHISSGKWHYVSVVVDAEEGQMSFYVDGKFSNAFKDLREEDITLQHQLIVFGGAKQGHLRGGGLRRVRIDNSLLHPTTIMNDAKFAEDQRKLNVVWYNLNENTDHANVIKNLSKKGIVIKECNSIDACVDAMENTFKKRVHCIVTTLTDIPIEDEEGNIKPSPLRSTLIKELRSAPKTNVSITDDLNERANEDEDNNSAKQESDDEQAEPQDDTNGETSGSEDLEFEEVQHADGLDDMQVGLLVSKCIRKRYPFQVPIVIDTTEPKAKTRTFIMGEQVKAKYKGKKYFPGVITKVDRVKGIYDVEYDDGDTETDVKAELIKPLNDPNKTRRRNGIEYWVNDDKLDMCSQMGISIAGSMDHIEELVTKQLSKRPVVSLKELKERVSQD